jgi:hypothetical protein
MLTKVDKGVIYATSELSTPLKRLIQDGPLKRTENSDGQYEYEKAK